MPLYEYQCKKCGQRTEKIRKFSDPPLTVCEKCGGELEQLLSSPAIQFKGAGWYVTDYSKKSSPPASESSATSAGSGTSDKSEKKETKSEGKSEAKESKKAAEPAKTSASKE